MTAPDGRGLPAGAFGMELIVDMAECDRACTTNPKEMTSFIVLLSEKFGMQVYGDPLVRHRGEAELAGWTVIQLGTTWDLTVRACDDDNSAFVDLLSRDVFDPDAVADFTVDFFGAQRHETQVIYRQAPGK